MPISDEEFANWCKVDNANRVVLVQLDYMYESSGTPTLGTIYLGTKFYTDNSSPPIRYRECLDGKAPLLFARSLTGPTLGNYSSSLGSIEINNENGEYDFILRLAIDNSEARVYLGALSWVFSDFRQLFAAMASRADAPSTRRISITLKDASALLNKSIGGEVLVGGTASSAQKYRPANIGLVYQVPLDVLDPVTLQYVHSDRGAEGGTAIQVYDRGIEVTFADNADGTASLAFPPDGQVTADVLAFNPGDSPLVSGHKVSDAFFMIVGDRCGFDSLGRYAGAGPTFTVGDEDDYPIGLSIPSAQNVSKTILPQVAQTGNCFWTILRLGNFSFGRLQPQDIDGLGLTPVRIRKDDIDNETLKAVKITDPTYYRLQCLMNKNWYVASDVAAAVDQDRQSLLRSEGLVLQQDEAVGTTYADAPELYDLSLAVSPVLPTLLSVDPTETPDPATVAATWMERQRFMYLPWLDGVSFRAGIQFYELELGDVVELTVNRFDCDLGELFQVIAIALLPVPAKVELTLLRRLTAEPIPEDWTRVRTDTDLSFQGATIIKPPVEPPPVPPILPPGVPSITSASFINLQPPVEPTTAYVRVQFAQGSVQALGDFNQTVAMNAAGTIAVVGLPSVVGDLTGDGALQVWERASPWSLTTTFTPTPGYGGQTGYSVSIADNGTIIATEAYGEFLHVWTMTAPHTWSHQLLDDTGATLLSEPQAVINRDGDVIAMINSYGDLYFTVWKLITGTWTRMQVVSLGGVNRAGNIAISDDGMMIAISALTGLGPPDHTLLHTYSANPGRTTWTLSDNITVLTDNGNTYTQDTQPIVMTPDTEFIAMVLPADQNGTTSGTTVLYQNGGGGFARRAYIRPGDNRSFGLGSVAISDDGGVLFISEPYYDGPSPPPYYENGRLFYFNNVHLLPVSSPIIMETHPGFHEIVNPYGNLTGQRFGESIACSADGTRLVVSSADSNENGLGSVDFFELVTLLGPGIGLYGDSFTGPAASFTGRAPDTIGGAYTAENGSLANLSVNGSGAVPSQDTNVIPVSVYPASTLNQLPDGGGYRLVVSFDITVLPATGATCTLDFAFRLESGDIWMNETYFFYSSGVCSFGPYIADEGGNELFSDSVDVSAMFTVGVHEVIMEARPGGTVWTFDGTPIASASGAFPIVPPDSFVWGNYFNNFINSGNINLLDIQVETL